MNRAFWPLLVVLLIATTVLIYWKRSWDNPAPNKQEITGEISYQEHPIDVKIDCGCPSAWVESKKTSATFNLMLRWQYSSPPHAAEQIYVYADAAGASVEPDGMIVAADTGQLSTTKWMTQSIPLSITPRTTGPAQLTFHFVRYVDPQQKETSPLGTIHLDMDFRQSFASSVGPLAYSVLAFICASGLFVWVDVRQRRSKAQSDKKVNEAKDQWEKAQVRLQAYFDANLFQVGLVFWVAVVVMAVGFGFVLWGVLLSIGQPATLTSTSGASVLSGIITEFIGATFMVIYRSTVAQANEFVTVLDRINRLGVAMQILDSIPDTEGRLKAEARARIASLLVDAKLTSPEPSSSLPHDGDKKAK